jgi:spoIIIJ-associated protein
MLEKQELEKIRKEAEIFFQRMTFPVKVEVSLDEETVNIKVDSEEPRILVGERGTILASIQKILRFILQRKIDKRFYLNLDINDYKQKKARYLKEMANEAAQEVALTKKQKILPPMSAYERRIIHLELADRPNVATQSIGEEPERRVIVKPYP